MQIEGQQVERNQNQQEKQALAKLERIKLDQGKRADDLKRDAAEAESKVSLSRHGQPASAIHSWLAGKLGCQQTLIPHTESARVMLGYSWKRDTVVGHARSDGRQCEASVMTGHMLGLPLAFNAMHSSSSLLQWLCCALLPLHSEHFLSVHLFVQAALVDPDLEATDAHQCQRCLDCNTCTTTAQGHAFPCMSGAICRLPS